MRIIKSRRSDCALSDCCEPLKLSLQVAGRKQLPDWIWTRYSLEIAHLGGEAIRGDCTSMTEQERGERQIPVVVIPTTPSYVPSSTRSQEAYYQAIFQSSKSQGGSKARILLVQRKESNRLIRYTTVCCSTQTCYANPGGLLRQIVEQVRLLTFRLKASILEQIAQFHHFFESVVALF